MAFCPLFTGKDINMDITVVLKYFARAATLLLVMPIHESAHGLMAKWLGDDTAERQGRITLNPFAHLDPLGAILMVVCGFGWAKPVEVNPTRFKKYRRGYALTALAGPVSNLIASFIAALAFAIIISFKKGQIAYYELLVGHYGTLPCVLLLLQFLVYVNIGLAVFNLIPIPPLDGFNILRAFTPAKFDRWVYQHQRELNYGFFVLVIALYFIPAKYSPLDIAADFLYECIMKAVMWIPQVINA